MGDNTETSQFEVDDGELTPEDLEALGEAEEPTGELSTETEEGTETEETTEETEESEETTETEETETETETEEQAAENMIPQSAFDERSSEMKQKIHLLKTDPEEFYRRYPDEERPEPATNESAPQTDGMVDLGSMPVKGGQYDGKTLNEVYQENPAEATRMQTEYIEKARAEEQRLLDQRTQLLAEAEKEVAEFQGSLSSELFEKPFSDLSPAEISEVEKVHSGVLEWMEKTGRGGGIMADAYYLMNRESNDKKAAAKGAESLIEQTNRGKVKVITSDTDPGELTGYDAFESMSEDQLEGSMDDMSEGDYNKFLKEAPKSLRKKHPDLPWA